MTRRRTARECALQALYALEKAPDGKPESILGFGTSSNLPGSLPQYSRMLIEGIQKREIEVDRIIAEIVKNWDFERLNMIDRIILRMGIYEMLFLKTDCPALQEVPAVVSITEAIEIAKRYSTDRSATFINGILDQVRIRFIK